jgi:uncharacterized protein YjbI with pentapeptide repeats
MARRHEERWSRRDIAPDKPSPFGTTANHLQDYRDAPLSRLELIEDLEISDGDFSGANLRHLRIAVCSFKNCVFDRAVLSQCVIRASKFEACRFRKTDFRLAQIGTSGTIFNRCIFEGVQTARMGFGNAIFNETEFRGEDWKHVDFNASGFSGCSFSGALTGITFRRNYRFPTERQLRGEPKKMGLHDVSFENAELFWVGFTNNCPLTGVKLPRSGSAFMCSTETLLKCADQTIQGETFDKNAGVAKFFNIVRVHSGTQREQVVSRNDIVRCCGVVTGAQLYEALRLCAADQEPEVLRQQ